MDPLTYSVELLGYSLGPKPLSAEAQHKVELINDINVLREKTGQRPLSAKEFDSLYDMQPLELAGVITALALSLNPSY